MDSALLQNLIAGTGSSGQFIGGLVVALLYVTSHGFQASWSIAARKAGIVGVTFNDLRGTAVTRLALVGCTEAQIAAITGHMSDQEIRGTGLALGRVRCQRF